MLKPTLLTLTLLLASSPARAADWPTFGGNPARSHFTAEALPAKPELHWTIQRPAPTPAWPISTRMPFDRADHPVAVGNTVYFGSSTDGKVYAVDAESGQERWSFYTGGPVRFAPTVTDGRVFAVSDDGFLYCLQASDGKPLWTKRGGPGSAMVLGNDRMISRHPARGGPLVIDNVVYFAAGIWPSEGIFLYALDAATGKTIWENNDSGGIYMAQPHGGAFADSGVAAQGYLVAANDKLLVPTGRAVPAAFDRATGKFLYFHLQVNRNLGGSSTLAIGPRFVNAGVTFDTDSGATLDKIGDGAVAAIPEGLLHSDGKALSAYRFASKKKIDRKGVAIAYTGLEKTSSIDVAGGSCLLVAGNIAIVGSPNRIDAVDLGTKTVAWSLEVDGNPYGIAFANGRLLVSTDRGTLSCFGGPVARKAVTHKKPIEANPYSENAAAIAAAEAIVRKTGVTDGYCADLACGDGALAYELAKRTKLHIVAVESDAEKVALARQRLDSAGLLGSRVSVIHADPAKSPLPRYFANLVVSGRSIDGTEVATDAARIQRPYGGLACFGKPDDFKVTKRGALAGAGEWTHQYAGPANTSCSDDTLLKGPLGILWYRDCEFAMPSRHGRGPAPLLFEGRLIVEGNNGLRTVDAYNGRTLWEFEIPNILDAYNQEHLMGAAGTGSNVCVSADGIFIRTGTKCYRIDAATGKKVAEFDAPVKPDGKAAPWGFIATDGGIVFGSTADDSHIVKHPYRKSDMSQLFTESTSLFAMDSKSGAKKWTYAAKHSIRHNAIAVGGGRVYLIDRPKAEMDRLDGANAKEHKPGELVALDAATGEVVWKATEGIYGTTLSLSDKHKTLVMSYQATRFKLPSELGGRMAAFGSADGNKLWDIEAKYTTRPLINDRTLYAQGGAWDLLSGEERPFPLTRSYGCGQMAGSANLMLFRSATLGYYDVEKKKGTISYGGIRPGCWINAIPAGGVVLVPDASAACSCSYLNQAWIALQPLGSE